MPSIKLGSRPKTFARVIKFKDLDGTELSVPVTYRYRTRKEYGAWNDELPNYPESKDAVDAEGKFSSQKYIELVSDWNAARLMQTLEGWGLDEPFNADTVKQLCDEMPACAEAIVDDYKSAILAGHLGN
jgi:hypothetical protein